MFGCHIPKTVNTYVLIHGAWHGAWSYEKLIPILRHAGHKAIAVDLPGHGLDMTPVMQVTLDAYVTKVVQTIDRVSGKVILVGHSMGGFVVSQVAQVRSDKISTLVYIAAFMPKNGETLMALAATDEKALVYPNLTISEDMAFSFFNRDSASSVFYNDCADQDISWATLRLNWQPGAPYTQPVKLTDAKFGSIRRIYIKTLRDRAITPAMQQRMIDAMPPERVIEMDTGHSPFLSQPDVLTNHLMEDI